MSSEIDRVIFVPVIHTDVESVENARKAVQKIRPDVVAVELDRGRYHLLMNPEENEPNGEIPFQDAAQDLMQQIAILEKSLGDITGSEAGEEMLVAIEEGRKVGAKIALIDRPIQATVQALLQVPLDEMYRLSGMMPEVSDDMEGMSVDELMSLLKEEGAVEYLLEQFETEFPALADALIHQRNRYIATALNTILHDVPGKIVAVLGAGHIEGVKGELQQLLRGAGS